MNGSRADYDRHPMDTNHTLKDLDSLERTIVKGIQAYEARNALIVYLVDSGVKQAEVARRINSIREKMGAEPITPDAIAATMKRVAKRSS